MARFNDLLDCVKPVFDYTYMIWYCSCCGSAIDVNEKECPYCGMELEWKTKPWFDVEDWICPMCGVGLDEDEYDKSCCYYCNCDLDWSCLNE